MTDYLLKYANGQPLPLYVAKVARNHLVAYATTYYVARGLRKLREKNVKISDQD